MRAEGGGILTALYIVEIMCPPPPAYLERPASAKAAADALTRLRPRYRGRVEANAATIAAVTAVKCVCPSISMGSSVTAPRRAGACI